MCLGERRAHDRHAELGCQRTEGLEVRRLLGQLGVALEEPLQPGRRDAREQDGRLAAAVLPCVRDAARDEGERARRRRDDLVDQPEAHLAR